MREVSIARVIRMTTGGALGGILAFLIVNAPARRLEIELTSRLRIDVHNPFRSGLEMAQQSDVHDILFTFLKALIILVLLDIVVVLVISLALTAAEELPSMMPARILGRLGRCLWLGLLYGIVGSAAADMVGLGVKPLEWAILGGAAGMVPGAVASSKMKSRFGMVGGLIGGAVSGVLFAILALVFGTGTVSRFVGLVVLGASIGAAVALVEECAKRHWITVLTGSREGRVYPITKPYTMLGRDELSDIPLFGDTTVQPCHAQLKMFDRGVQVLVMPGAAVAVNGVPANDLVLRDGDEIAVGRHRLRFSSKGTSGSGFLYGRQHPLYGVGPQPQPMPVPSQTAYQPTKMMQQPAVAVAISRLEIIAGPHVGLYFTLTPDRMFTIGRDPSSSIPLTQDTLASRRHASLTPDGINWRLDDLGSTNGLWVNGQRVTTHILAAGDQIGVGQTVIRVG